MKVIAISSFDHYGSRRRGDEFEVSEQVALQLVRAGLVRCEGAPTESMQGNDLVPKEATGQKSSASPVARVSQEQTAKPSGTGRRGRRNAG
jgi:hypothetical protein